MVNASDSHGHAYGVFISPEGWRTLAGGNTPGANPIFLHPGGVPENTLGRPIRPIPPLHPPTTSNPKSALSPTCHRPIIWPENKGIKPKSNRHKPKNLSRLIDSDCELRSLCCLLWEIPVHSTFFGHPFCTLCQPMPAYPSPPLFFGGMQSRFNSFLHANIGFIFVPCCLGS
jgi:hypothetical protein